MKLVENNFITRKLLGVNGIVLWPFIFVHDKTNPVLLNHERIHEAQIKDCGVIKFYTLYLWYYKKTGSYRSIPFEVEAFEHQYDMDYLKNRPKRNWEFKV